MLKAFLPALVVLLSAFLIFQVQPVVAKSILPWFGGTTAVWTTAMLFFQTLLFLGYAYAHFSIRWLSPRWQGRLHVGLIFAALAVLPLTPDPGWTPTGDGDPTWRILGLLAGCVGLPYFLLSATGPLLQAWLSRSQPQAAVYRLYALSNAGSLAALVSYPFLFEPLWPISTQQIAWTLGFGGFALACGWVALGAWRHTAGAVTKLARSASEGDNAEDHSLALRASVPWLRWVLWPAGASAALLATTNHICQDIASLPLLWIAPLAIYLITFIVAFDRERWYARRTVAAATAGMCLVAGTLSLWMFQVSLVFEVLAFLTMLFYVCWLCHGELVRLKPSADGLTAFYLCCAGGGALGGVLVNLLAPLAFDSFAELRIVLAAGFVMGCWLTLRGRGSSVEGPGPEKALPVSGPRRWTLDPRPFAAAVVLAGLWLLGRGQVPITPGRVVAATRNFYGVLNVDEADADDPLRHAFILRHGRVLHGLQFAAEDRRRIPTTYYDERSGVGLALVQTGKRRPLRVGAIGLGVGTLAAYGRAGDHYRFYEINPEVLRLANEHFTYLQDSPADVECVLGDARLSLDREPPQRFDVLALDAFSGDAIPTHLLTREALAIYRRHLADDGVLAIHVTNRHIDLEPVVRALAVEGGYSLGRVETSFDEPRRLFASTWLLLSRSEEFFAGVNVPRASAAEQAEGSIRLWTDDFSNVLAAMR